MCAVEWTEASWRERKCPNLKKVAKGDSKPGSLDCESGILPNSLLGVAIR